MKMCASPGPPPKRTKIYANFFLVDKLIELNLAQVQFVESADKLIVMKDGKIVVQGPPDRVFEENPEEMKEIIQVR